MDELTDAEIVALAYAIPAKRLTEAKDKVGSGSCTNVDFQVRISGPLSKGVDQLDGTSTAPQNVSFANLPVFCYLLKQLHVGPKRLRDLLLKTSHICEPIPELEAVFNQVAKEASEALPMVERTVAGRRGSIKFDPVIRKL
jgi:hypothetical protein